MNWVDFEGVTFNLDHVTHFGIEEDGHMSQLRAYLPFGDAQVEKDPIAYFIVTMDTYEECKQWLRAIIAGKHNLPCKGHLYPIREHLNQMNIYLGKIESHLKLLTGIKQ